MDAAPPKGVSYNAILPLAMAAKTSVRKFRPQQTNSFDYANGQRVIRIPLTSSGFLDPLNSYLRFNIRATTTDSAQTPNAGRLQLDGGAWSVINRLRVEGSDGAELERIENYNVLCGILNTYSVNTNTRSTFDSVSEGSQVYNRGALGTGSFHTLNGQYVPTHNVKTSAPGTTAGDGATVSQTFCIKLASAMFNSNKYIPVGFISGAGLTLEITLEDPNTAFIDSQAAISTRSITSYIVDKVEYVGTITEFSTDFEAAFGASLMQRGPVFWHGTTYHNYVYSTTNQNMFNIPIAERARSLKNLMVAIRDAGKLTGSEAAKERSITRRIGYGISSYQFKIGSQVYPMNPVSEVVEATADKFRHSHAETFMEATKCFGATNSVVYEPSVFYNNPDSNASYSTNAFMDPNFLLAVDLERFPADSGMKEMGLNTAAQALNIECEIRCDGSSQKIVKIDSLTSSDSALTTNEITNVRFDVFSSVDALFKLDATGTVSVVV